MPTLGHPLNIVKQVAIPAVSRSAYFAKWAMTASRCLRFDELH